MDLMRPFAVLAALASVTFSFGQVEEAKDLISRPMNTAAVERALTLTERGDMAAKRVLFAYWRKEARTVEDYLYRFGEKGEKEFARRLFAAIENEVRGADFGMAKTAMTCLAFESAEEPGPLLRDREDWCGTTAGPSDIFFGSQEALRKLCAERPDVTVAAISEADSFAVQWISFFAFSSSPEQVKKVAFRLLDSKDKAIRQSALRTAIRSELNPSEIALVVGLVDQTFGDELLGVFESESISTWVKSQPFSSLPRWFKLNYDFKELPEEAKTDADIAVRLRALYATEPMKRETVEAILRLSAPTDENLLYLGRDHPELVLPALPKASREVQAAVVYGMITKSYDLTLLPKMIELAPYLRIFMTPFSVSFKNLTPPWPDAAETFFASPNAAAKMFGLTHLPRSIDLAEFESMLSSQDVRLVWTAQHNLDRVKKEQQKELHRRHFGGLPRTVQFDTLRNLYVKNGGYAQDILSVHAHSRDPQIGELARKYLSMPPYKESPIRIGTLGGGG